MQTHPFDAFGTNLFSQQVMKERLPFPIYQKWKTATRKEDALDLPTADAIAHAMKTWAMEKGVTHFTHWFQPMGGSTAEKHESFIEPGDYMAISRFSGKNLIKGEGDASSFPNGGLRATFEARGYTYWDCTSPAFIRENVLCIPTIFVSYNGETLDKKAPLLKSIDAISKQATRIVNLFKDKDIKQVQPMVGLEQEYFLVDRELFHERMDLRNCGRTLFGALPPRAQAMSDHYFGAIPDRVSAFMRDVDEELWKLGIYAKTEHNEAAPCQFEIAPLYAQSNIAVDQNQIIMDVLRQCAARHHLACLLHEKPFEHVNGSGKHNNWSLVSDDGQNLLEPGEKPHENIRFLLFVCAIIQAVDTYPELLRMAASSYSNDYRLGGHEAPPAIISICMGNYLEDILLRLEKGDMGINPTADAGALSVVNLAYVPKDTSDRNRTSPFAFTGNKFEFRMVGSSRSAATTNTVLNTIVADTLKQIADELQQYKYIDDIRKTSLKICRGIIQKHRRILFSGDGYAPAWRKEAKERGLPHIPYYVYSIASLTEEKAVALFERNQVYHRNELLARSDILYTEFINSVHVEVKTLLDVSKKSLLPALIKEIRFYSDALKALPSPHPFYEKKVNKLLAVLDRFHTRYHNLKHAYLGVRGLNDHQEIAYYLNDQVVVSMRYLREVIDELEESISYENYPMPTYEELFASVDEAAACKK
ncbi:glutamine synthetase III [Massilicoli timonensis]|uniref:glutamine synthetase III family protein n=1 Tax=Massilicoli timonensis TaxID=2015901 RepID=UPI003AB0D10F